MTVLIGYPFRLHRKSRLDRVSLNINHEATASSMRCAVQEVRTILPVGTVIRERYIIEDLLGKGGFGAVYLVKDLRVRSNLYALKEVVDPNKLDRQRFLFEGEVLKRLDHPALPHVYRAFEDEKYNRAYLLMDYIEGNNLEVLRHRQPKKQFALPQVLNMMAPIIHAVSYLHNQNPPIIHRDIKPANIIGSPEGNQSVLVDFGIAKEYDPDSTTAAVRHCSPGYGAPEQYSRGTDTRTDIYGLGATIYALLAGTVPADALYRMTQLGNREVDPLEPVNQLAPDVPQSVAAALARAMSINIQDRFSTVEQFWQALNNHGYNAYPVASVAPIAPQLIALTRVPTGIPRIGSRRKAGVLLLILLALLIGVASVSGFLYYAMSHPHTAAQLTPTTIVHHQPTVGISPTPKPKATGIAKPTATPGPTPTPTLPPTPIPPPPPPPTATPMPTPTPTQGFPNVAGNYNGMIHDTDGNITTSMTLSIQQSGATISGQFTVGSGLLGSGPFTGIVNALNAIQFTVQGYNGNAPLSFQGTVASNGSMAGQYCSLDTTNQCNPKAGGYGSWNVLPPAPTGSALRKPPFLSIAQLGYVLY